ncbi:MAG: protoporphyrinogen oxidase [Opitutaceae bacterium]
MANSNQSKRIAIIGGGITGLTAAWRLHSRGHRVRLFEAGERLGGAVRSERSDGWLVEAGPNTIQVGAGEIGALLDELGLGEKKLAANPAAKNRYLVRGGRLHALPASPSALLKSKLFSFSGKVRALADFLAPRLARTEDLSLAEFVRTHFGQELVDYALEPFVAGIFAGDPEMLSTRHSFPPLLEIERTHGSLLRGQIALARQRRAQGAPPPQLLSFPDGLQTVIETLAAALPAGTIALRAKIDAIQPGPPWRITWQEGACVADADAVILAIPAPALVRLHIGGGLPLADLSTIEYPPVASLFLGFKREQVTHPLDGFGLLVPKRESLPMLGVLFSSTMFPGRAPAGHVGLTVMAGGARQPELARLLPDALLTAVMPGLRSLLGVRGNPVFARHTAWPHAIPQYNLGYERFHDVMASVEKSFPGLLIGGHVRDGIALSACITSGLRLADRAGAA